jgi:hypothetical protein
MDLKLAKPRRPDTMTPGAIEAVERMRFEAWLRRLSFVTVHGVPRGSTRDRAPKPPAGYARVKRIAEEHGWTVTEYTSRTGYALQGRRGDLGFRAYWQWGKTTGASWHERTPRWTLVDDPRPIKMNTRDHVGLKGYRSEGMGRVRLALLADPYGLPINVTTLEERLAAS